MKLKYHSLYGQLLQDRVLMKAWKQVKANKGSGGIDGITIDKYAMNEQENIFKLLEKLKKKEYKPTPVRRVYIPKKDGKKRPLRQEKTVGNTHTGRQDSATGIVQYPVTQV